MAEIDIICLLAVLLSFGLAGWCAWIVLQAGRRRAALQARPPRDELADLDDFITQLDKASTDEEVNQLEKKRKEQWRNSSSQLSSG